MKPKDIKVGQRYYNLSQSGVWLGVGKRVMWENKFHNEESDFKNKHLVFIEGDSNFIGQIVQNPKDCYDGFWDGFVEETRFLKLPQK